NPYDVPIWKLADLEPSLQLPTFQANVDFNLTASIAHNLNLPTIKAEFLVQWNSKDDFGNDKHWSLDRLLVPDYVGFLNVRLSMGQFISGAVKALFQDL